MMKKFKKLFGSKIMQNLLINIETIFIDLNIFVEKRIDKEIFKRKNIKINEFKEIFSEIKLNYEIINGYLSKFKIKIDTITELINNEIHSNKILNTMNIQYNKLKIEHNKVFELMNQTINFYYEITLEYLKNDIDNKYTVFEGNEKINIQNINNKLELINENLDS